MHECMNEMSCMLVTDPTSPLAGNWYNKVRRSGLANCGG